MSGVRAPARAGEGGDEAAAAAGVVVGCAQEGRLNSLGWIVPLVSTIGVFSHLGVAIWYYGRMAERVSSHGRRIGELEKREEHHGRQIGKHGERIARLEAHVGIPREEHHGDA